MPIFQFKKLVRDKLRDMYAEIGQEITFRKLKGNELRVALRGKLIEEASEIPIDAGAHDNVIAELADVEQLLDDMKREYGITDEEVDIVKKKKFAKKGGFSEGIFVESIELRDDDEWVEYYRKEPLKYREIKGGGKVDPDLPQLAKGKYCHSKSEQLYEVIGVTFNTETDEPLVIYRPLYEHEKYELFARPYDMFVETIELNGEMKPRFEKVVE